MSKKNLDKLFQEKLKDFREIPDDKVWESIEDSLDQRQKRRRVVPLWWKLGGIAAVLAIALLVINPFGSTDPVETIITDVEQTDTEPPVDIQKEEDRETDEAKDSEVVSSPEETKTESGEREKDLFKSIEDNIVQQDQDQPQPSIKEDFRGTVTRDQELANQQKDPEITDPVNLETPETKNEEVVVMTDEERSDKTVDSKITDIDPEEENAVVSESTTEKMIDGETVVAEQTVEEEIKTDSGKKSIFDEINKEEEEALAENSESKWSVGPTVAPVYFNSFGEGSPIHSNFVSNSKSGNVNLSYGFSVNYEVTDKLSIRSGLHKVDYGYDTNDITFSSSLVASTSTQITNINYTNTSRNLVVESSSNPEVVQDFAANDIIAPSPSRSGRMVQEFGYIELPMELNYSLVDRKFNVDIIGGFSSLFLVNNSVSLEDAGSSTQMGEANNLNDVNFSTNIGLGINYELTDKMKVHLEPMFKYQLNTFSEVEGNFQPYTLGVYTGMSFKF